MYGKYKKYKSKSAKRKMSPTRKAFLAGVKAGKRIARSKRRWY